MTPAPGPPPEPHYRILLVEDDPGDALLVTELLADTGLRYALTWHKTLGEARSELAAQAADCVLLDLHLPDASGPAGVAAVQAAAPDTAVIVLTGLAESQAGPGAMAAGAQDYLVKGKVEPELLQRAVRYAVQRKQAERAAAALQAGALRAEENSRLERGLLPRPLLTTEAVTATSRYIPGRERALLGGDFLDVVQTGDGLVHAVIGDASGHGPDAAALGVCLRVAWRALTLGGHRGRDLLRLLERILVAERAQSDLFATCTLLTLDLSARTATLHLAGHHEPLLTADAGTGPVEAEHGIALGIMPDLAHWPPTTFALPARGALTLYTDGLVEGHADGTGGSGERLGADGLLALIGQVSPADPGAHLDRVIARIRDLDADRHTDDLAVLRLDWGAP
ncbi:SpoIIE family protein phosphatase [Streptomyces sp. NPDC088354]|uniref:SpoIIE family protein phosphatase n=1 Tax=unclassified Streptomyces TaxID=2593676 RepID=UPI0029B00FB6|nr:SpoIIE family protein phosphatase [Streptomyces sp. MI02-7b]MDX3076935.1 SpoIIE family protein phosphatase [Streptomyces sp. MI02-7b]